MPPPPYPMGGRGGGRRQQRGDARGGRRPPSFFLDFQAVQSARPRRAEAGRVAASGEGGGGGSVVGHQSPPNTNKIAPTNSRQGRFRTHNTNIRPERTNVTKMSRTSRQKKIPPRPSQKNKRRAATTPRQKIGSLFPRPRAARTLKISLKPQNNSRSTERN